MLTYIIRRLLWSVLLLFVVSFVVFLVFYTLPASDPALLRAGRNPDPALVKILDKRYGLDKPFYVQFWFYIKALVLHFDFGRSYQNNVDVRPYIFERLPATISLAIGAAVIWLLIGIPIGILAAVKRGTWIEKAAMGVALIGISAPVVKLATWPRACTPASVRPATVSETGSRRIVSSAVSSSPCTVRRPGCAAHPRKPPPS